MPSYPSPSFLAVSGLNNHASTKANVVLFMIKRNFDDFGCQWLHGDAVWIWGTSDA